MRDIHLDRAPISAELHHGAACHGLANPMEHEPCGLLSDAERAGNLARANAILRSGDEPHGREPLLKAQWRVFKDGSDLAGKLALRVAALALPLFLIRQIGDILAATGRAFDTLWPAVRDHIGEAIVCVSEVNYGFLKCLWRSHVLRIRESS